VAGDPADTAASHGAPVAEAAGAPGRSAAEGLLPVPFVPQQKDTCAAAALSMVLAYHGRDVPHDAIAAALVEKELRGIRGSRLADFARERGMVAVAFAGDMGLLREHLARGRPLILAIGAGRGRYHDVVAVGIDDERRALIVNDPAEGAGRAIPLTRLAKKWKATGNWTLLVQPAEARDDAPGRDGAAVAALDGRMPERADASRQPDAQAAEAAVAHAATDAAGEGHDYDALVARAIVAAHAGDHAKATSLLDRAIAADEDRPEAWTERGGVRFLDGRYSDAADDLRRALAIREDAYARDLLAAALQLDGRELEALAAWNPLGKPTLEAVEIAGLEHTKDGVARREIELEQGETVTPGAVRAARRRLEETGAFDRVTIRAASGGDGTSTLGVALAERHGLGRPLDLAVTTAVNLAWRRFRVRYSNLGGTGISIGASLRWQENRPEAAVQLQAPRPFGVPAYLRLTAFGGEQAYLVGDGLDMRRHGLDASLRHVVDGRTVLSVGLRARDRTFSRPEPGATPGRVTGLEGGVETRLFESRRHRATAALRLFGATPALGSDLRFGQADAELRYEGVLSRPEGRSVERSVLAARLRAGSGSEGLPIDEMYAPGISPESDLPLRAHPLTRGGAIGANAMGRRILLANVEWRQRLVHRPAFDIGVTVFADGARIGSPTASSVRDSYLDAGVGLRIALLAGPTIRVDHGWGLLDGRRALFIGLGQAF
jgi:tetratricopeptide (TPR) repeat protein